MIFINDDDKKHDIAEESDEDNDSALGSSSSDIGPDVDNLVEGVGIRPDSNQGPKELDALADLASNRAEE